MKNGTSDLFDMEKRPFGLRANNTEVDPGGCVESVFISALCVFPIAQASLPAKDMWAAHKVLGGGPTQAVAVVDQHVGLLRSFGIYTSSYENTPAKYLILFNLKTTFLGNFC